MKLPEYRHQEVSADEARAALRRNIGKARAELAAHTPPPVRDDDPDTAA